MTRRPLAEFDRATAAATLPAVERVWPGLAVTVRTHLDAGNRVAALEAVNDVRDELPPKTEAALRREPEHVRALHALAMGLASDNASDAAGWVREAKLG